MGETTEIAWCHATFNPWRGCQRVSPGCEHCYAESLSKRFGLPIWGPKAPRLVASESYWRGPLKWNRDAAAAGERRRVFCASMADVFEDREDLDPSRRQLFDLIEQTPNLDWLLLTKRPENMLRLAPAWDVDAWPSTRSAPPCSITTPPTTRDLFPIPGWCIRERFRAIRTVFSARARCAPCSTVQFSRRQRSHPGVCSVVLDARPVHQLPPLVL